jgi:predicted metal-binding protein
LDLIEGKESFPVTRIRKLMGLLSCGDCPGAGIVPRLAQVNLWNKPLDEKPTKIHIGPCLADIVLIRKPLSAKLKQKPVY